MPNASVYNAKGHILILIESNGVHCTSHAGDRQTNNQHPMLVSACKKYLMLVTSNAGLLSMDDQILAWMVWDGILHFFGLSEPSCELRSLFRSSPVFPSGWLLYWVNQDLLTSAQLPVMDPPNLATIKGLIKGMHIDRCLGCRKRLVCVYCVFGCKLRWSAFCFFEDKKKK